MVSSRQMALFIEMMTKAVAKLVLVGGPEQLQPIEAGAAFRPIADRDDLSSAPAMDAHASLDLVEAPQMLFHSAIYIKALGAAPEPAEQQRYQERRFSRIHSSAVVTLMPFRSLKLSRFGHATPLPSAKTARYFLM